MTDPDDTEESDCEEALEFCPRCELSECACWIEDEERYWRQERL